MSKRMLRDGIKAAYIPKQSHNKAGSERAVDFVTTQRLRAIDEKLDRALADAVETLQEIRALRHK